MNDSVKNTDKLLLKWVAVTLCCALLAFLIPFITGSFFAQDRGIVVIVLDPGHGGADTGAVNEGDGLYEADLNLAIALACRDELLKYDGVEVYMTHEGLDYDKTLPLSRRVDRAKEVGADMLISLHCNDADNKEAHGAEVYVSHSTYSEHYNQESTSLAVRILNRLKHLDLTIRGVKTRLSGGDREYYHDDGSVELGDYYAVIGETIRKHGIPGILVEHGFVSGDAALLDSQEDLSKLGAADAAGIADYYGLKLKTDGGESPEKPEEIVLVTDADLLSASDAEARIIALPDNISPNHGEALEKAQRAYESLTPEGKTLVPNELVAQLYRAVLLYDSKTHPVRIEAVEESGFAVNRVNHTIGGADLASNGLSGTNVSGLRGGLVTFYDFNYLPTNFAVSSADIAIVAPDGSPMDIAAQVGTGCRAQLWVDGTLADELSVIIPYDLSGDGVCDSLDRYLLEDYLYNGAQFNAGQLAMADVNGDGRIDELDISELNYQISQNRR